MIERLDLLDTVRALRDPRAHLEVALVREEDLAALEGEVQFLLDGLGVSSLAELKRLVDSGREYDGLRNMVGLFDGALLGVPLS